MNNEQKRIVRNYNARVRYLEKQNIPDLPGRVGLRELKSYKLDANQLERRLTDMSLFTAKKAKTRIKTKSGKYTSLYNIEKLERDLPSAIDMLESERNIYGNSKIKIGGKETGFSVIENGGDPLYNSYTANIKMLRQMQLSINSYIASGSKEGTLNVDPSTIRRRVEQLDYYNGERNKKAIQYKENYINFLEKLGNETGVNDEEFINYLKSLSSNEFYRFVEQEKLMTEDFLRESSSLLELYLGNGENLDDITALRDNYKEIVDSYQGYKSDFEKR